MHQLIVSVEGFNRITLRGRGTVVSYIIRVNQEGKEWVVYHTEDQFKALDNLLHKKPSLEGFLWKKATVSGIKGWNKRYFKLVGNTLFYSNDSDAAVPKRSIHLLDASMIVPSSDINAFGTGLVGGETLDGRGSFEIRVPNQTIYLNAPTRDLMETWVAKLNTAKRNRYSQSPPPMRPKSAHMSDMEVLMYEQKRVNYDIFLKSLCDYYYSTEYLNTFLLLNKYPNEKHPQHRMMVDAIQSNFNLIVDLHENHGVPIDFVYKEVPFIYEACSVGALPVVQYILSTEPDLSIASIIKSTDLYNRTPLSAACSSACFELANLLIAHGGMVDVPPGTATPLHLLARCAEPALGDQEKILETLVKALASKFLNSIDEFGQTPLHICVKKCYFAMLPLLLNLGADYNVVDSTGKNVLHLVASNNSARAHAVMNELLQFMGKNVPTLTDFTKNIQLLEYCDNENKTALQYAMVEPGCFRHVTLLQQHYLRLEEYRFTQLLKDLLQQKPDVTISGDEQRIVSMKGEFEKTFKCIIEFLNGSCSINDYHSDISKLIEKTLDHCDRTFNVLHGLEIHVTALDLLEDKVMTGIYPVLHSLFLKKNKFLDNIFTQNLLLFKENVTHEGFSIPDKLWLKIYPNKDRAIDCLNAVPTKVKPQDKLDCISKAIELIECDGADDIVPCLAYLMVQGADSLGGGIKWVAELDYISKINATGNFILLQGMVSFFQTASMKKKNGIIYVEGVDALATNTTYDLACLWVDVKKEDNALDEMQAVYNLFLNCANNFSGVNEVQLECSPSEKTLTNHYMKSILTRLQIVIMSKGEQCVAKYGDFVDQSIFAKIACSFATLPVH